MCVCSLLMAPGLSKDIQCHGMIYDHTLSYACNHQIIFLSTGAGVGMYGLTYSLYQCMFRNTSTYLELTQHEIFPTQSSKYPIQID